MNFNFENSCSVPSILAESKFEPKIEKAALALLTFSVSKGPNCLSAVVFKLAPAVELLKTGSDGGTVAT